MNISEIQLFTNNLESTEEFYNKILGLGTIYKNDKEIIFFIGKTKIIFVRSEKQNAVYHLAFDIPVNKLDEAFEFMKKRVPVLPVTENSYISDIKHWNAKSFYFYDNNGSVLELIARFDNHNQSDAPFDGASLLYVSEVGIATDDVSKLASGFINQYGLQYYTKQPPMEGFVALGDETGLFIIVDQNRPWYPTQKKAGLFSVDIKFKLPGQPETHLVIDTKSKIHKHK
jgi:catechol-2,3-dioxygenase